MSSCLPEFPPDSHNLKALEENVCTWAVESARSGSAELRRGKALRDWSWMGDAHPPQHQLLQMCGYRGLFSSGFASKNPKLTTICRKPSRVRDPRQGKQGSSPLIPATTAPFCIFKRSPRGLSRFSVHGWGEGRGKIRTDPRLSLEGQGTALSGTSQGFTRRLEPHRGVSSPPQPG